jgi:elongation factor G
VRARVPEAELYRYANALRSMTQGRAAHTRQPGGYEPVPEQEARKVIDRVRAEGATAGAH